MGQQMHGEHGGNLLLLHGLIWCFHSPCPVVGTERGRSQPQAGQVGLLGAVLAVKLSRGMSRKGVLQTGWKRQRE